MTPMRCRVHRVRRHNSYWTSLYTKRKNIQQSIYVQDKLIVSANRCPMAVDGDVPGDVNNQPVDPEEVMKGWAQERRRWRLKIFAMAVAIIITVSVLSVVFFTLTGCIDCNGFRSPQYPYAYLDLREDAKNWTLHVSYVYKAGHSLVLDSVTATIFDRNGAPMTPLNDVPLTNLTLDNFTMYHVRYQSWSDEKELAVLGKFTITKAAYQMAGRFELFFQGRVLSRERLYHP